MTIVRDYLETLGRRRHREQQLPGDRLVGGVVAVNRKTYTVKDILNPKGSGSQSYLAEKHDGSKVVVRIFALPITHEVRKPVSLRDVQDLPGVISYTHSGIGRLSPLKYGNDQESRKYYCLVRPFEPCTLAQLNTQSRLTEISSTLSVLTDIAIGLASLHGAGVVHGDLRPSNILLRNDGKARVADFGLTLKALRHRPRNAMNFASPESLLHEGIQGKAGDVYSFGKIARLLISVASDLSTRQKSRLEWITAECLDIEPSNRPNIETVRDVIDVDVSSMGPSQEEVWHLDDFTSAVLADMDARIPDICASQIDERLLAVQSAAESIDVELANQRGVRLLTLSRPETVHLVATLAFMKSKQQHGSFTLVSGTSKLDTVMALERDPSAPIDESWTRSLHENFRHPSEDERDQLLNEYSFLPPLDRERISGSNTTALDSALARQLQDATRERNALLDMDTYVRSEDVAAIMSVSCPGITVDEVRVLRDFGYLIAVPHQNRNIYPTFQFERRSGLPFDSVKYVSDMFDTDGSPWGILAWWLGASRDLEGSSPAEWLREQRDDDAVTKAAYKVVAA